MYVACDSAGLLPAGADINCVPAFTTADEAIAYGVTLSIDGKVFAQQITRTTAFLKDIDEVSAAIGVPPGDWVGLVRFFESTRRDKRNKKIAPYTEVGRQRKAVELKTFSEGCWTYAVDAVLFALDNHYQGFSDGGALYFKGDLELYRAREALSRC
jgi:hypothetical protein